MSVLYISCALSVGACEFSTNKSCVVPIHRLDLQTLLADQDMIRVDDEEPIGGV